MISFDDAQQRLADAGVPIGTTEKVALTQAAGRILAEIVVATLDLPPADNSAMDGYAIRATDFQPGVVLPIQERSFAGDKPQPLTPGHATRLFTGSIMPAGADTVIMQEDTEEADGEVKLLVAPRPGQHVRKRGEDTTTGRELIAAGTLLTAAHLTLLASQGVATVTVFTRLRMGILTTGDELVAPGEPRGEAQIYNSNGIMLATLATGLGADVVHVLHAIDTKEDLQRALRTLVADCDLVVSVGGVSVGERDLVKPAIEDLGGTLDLWKVKMKPGKPVALAHIDDTPIVCLPGNPVSAFAVFTLLVSPLIRRRQGRADIFPAVYAQTLRTEQPHQDDREEFLRVRASTATGGNVELTAFGQQGSGIISSLPWASGLARIPAGTAVYDGEKVAYYDFSRWLA